MANIDPNLAKASRSNMPDGMEHADRGRHNKEVNNVDRATNESASTSMPVIAVRDLAKTYRLGRGTLVHALRGVSLDIYPGEFVAVMGPSGSGKSSFMNLIGCLDRPSKGAYWLDGKLVSRLSNSELALIRNQRLGFVFQGFNLLSRATALRNVALPMVYAGVPKREREQLALKLLYIVGLGKRIHHKPSELSGGQQQRVAIARALVNAPSLLLADEPTGNLDSRTSVEIMGVLQALNEQGLTIVLVTHEPDIAEYAKRRVVFRDGRLIRDEPVRKRRSAQAEWEELKKTQPFEEDEADRKETQGESTSADPATHLATQVTTQEESPPLASHFEDILQDLSGRRRGSSSMLLANLRNAIEVLWTSKMRSFLTTLGIFIGVAAVVAMLILSQGGVAYITDQTATLGKTITIVPGSAESRLNAQGGSVSSTLTQRDVLALQHIPHVAKVSPFIVTSNQVVYGRQNWATQVQGVDINVQEMQEWKIAQGSWFSGDEDAAGEPVAVLGSTVADNLFSTAKNNVIGQQIRIRDSMFRVIGVLAAKGGSANPDDVVMIPFKAAQKYLRNTDVVNQILLQVDDVSNVEQAAQSTTAILKQNHHISGSEPDDFQVSTFTQVLQQIAQQLQVTTTLLVGIAVLSLMVGGTGVMNIMLVSVTQRTWEIGIRMSIGARRYDICNQFLIESFVLCMIGGAIGILLGLFLGSVMAQASGFPRIVTVTTFLVPFAVSSGIALLFGLYPAIRASFLDPVVAIRTS
jgi:macrolide transport system ATP-binding/permease protein